MPRALRLSALAAVALLAAACGPSPDAPAPAEEEAYSRADAFDTFSAYGDAAFDTRSAEQTGWQGDADPAGDQTSRPAGLVRFSEPTEGAYALGVPRGWQASGGVLRGPVTTIGLPWLRAMSPDGATRIASGRRSGPIAFVQPGPGFTQPVPWAAVRALVPADALAEEVARAAAQEAGCRSAVEVTERVGPKGVLAEMPPALRQRWEQNAQQARQSGSQMTLAGVVFRCGSWTGYADVTRQAQRQQDGVGWMVFPGAVLTQGRLASARALGRQMATTFEISPAWTARQQQADLAFRRDLQQRTAASRQAMQRSAQTYQAAQPTGPSAADIQMEGWRRRQGMQDEGHRRSVNGISETVDLASPTTGSVYYGAPQGADAYWIGPDAVIGTQGTDNPDPFQYEQGVNLDDVYDY